MLAVERLTCAAWSDAFQIDCVEICEQILEDKEGFIPADREKEIIKIKAFRKHLKIHTVKQITLPGESVPRLFMGGSQMMKEEECHGLVTGMYIHPRQYAIHCNKTIALLCLARCHELTGNVCKMLPWAKGAVRYRRHLFQKELRERYGFQGKFDLFSTYDSTLAYWYGDEGGDPMDITARNNSRGLEASQETFFYRKMSQLYEQIWDGKNPIVTSCGVLPEQKEDKEEKFRRYVEWKPKGKFIEVRYTGMDKMFSIKLRPDYVCPRANTDIPVWAIDDLSDPLHIVNYKGDYEMIFDDDLSLGPVWIAETMYRNRHEALRAVHDPIVQPQESVQAIVWDFSLANARTKIAMAQNRM